MEHRMTDGLSRDQLYRRALALASFTILYNLAEGIASTWLGMRDEEYALFGFGLDSFIELISGMGVAVMVVRMQQHPRSEHTQFEKQALQVTGFSFYMLVVGLLLSAGWAFYSGHKPETTRAGVIISLVSLLVMGWMMWYKTKIAKALNSTPLLADAHCTRVCMYMSGVLLVSAGIHELTTFPYADALGALGLAWFSFTEGRECFAEAKDMGCNCAGGRCGSK